VLATVIDFCIPFSKRDIFLTSEDELATWGTWAGFFWAFYFSKSAGWTTLWCGDSGSGCFPLFPNWIDGTLFGFLPYTMAITSAYRILPYDPDP
jgi:hypothetical protein